LVENKRSDAVLIRLLEARFPEEFRRRTENVNLLEIDPEKLSVSQIDLLVDAILANHVGNDMAAAAEARKLIEAGGVVETTAEVVEP
jgi:hypothetical protein